MQVWRGAVTGVLSGVKKNAVMLLRWLPNFDYVTVMLPVLLCSGPAEAHLNSTRYGTANGSMAAGYFNPKSIHVAQAEASREGGVMKVFIELRDVNYPGSTYTLTYDPASAQLKGVYYQAVEKQRFPVAFVQMK